MIRMGHVIVCPMIFALLSNQVRKDGELKLMKNDDVKYFSPFGSFPPSFWAFYCMDYSKFC